MTSGLEARVAVLESEIRTLKSAAETAVRAQEARHAENGMRLTAIETTTQEIKNTLLQIEVYTKIGRRLMNIAYVIMGGMGSAVLLKWFGVTR